MKEFETKKTTIKVKFGYSYKNLKVLTDKTKEKLGINNKSSRFFVHTAQN